MENPQSIEAVGKTVEEAIGRGLDALNVTRDQVGVEVIDPGDGKRLVRVRVTITAPISTPAAQPIDAAAEPPAAPPSDEEVHAACEALSHILRLMHVRAEVEARAAVAEDELDQAAQGGPPIVLNIQGNDLGILIGRRGETLRDLQYLVRQIVAKQVGRNLNLVVDVEGYKNRREQTLRQLAMRMAERVATTHQSIALEPMPANERRIIHLALRNHPTVTTQSVGVGEARKVTLIPKSRQ